MLKICAKDKDIDDMMSGEGALMLITI